ncbi:hypothetical protein H8959_001383 [Pygathrix nigripes]
MEELNEQWTQSCCGENGDLFRLPLAVLVVPDTLCVLYRGKPVRAFRKNRLLGSAPALPAAPSAAAPPLDTPTIVSQITINLRDKRTVGKSCMWKPLLLLLPGFKCPICSKSVASDEMEMHFIMCLSKPRLSYNDDVLTKDAGECVICLEELLQGDTIARLPCLCIYHKSCIDSWFEVNRSCPEHPAD